MYHGERFNSVTAAAGAVAASAAAAVLLVLSARQGDPWKIASFGVYGITLVLLYSFSTLYHVTRGPYKRLFRRLDRLSIYLLIAGTYTPFALVTLRGWVGWTIFAAVWGLALAGVALDTSREKRRGMLPVVVYLLMGWMCVLAIKPLLDGLPRAGFYWLLAGGLFYSVGVVFFVLDRRVRHFHGAWHLFVLAGSVSHYIAIIRYVL